MTTTNILGGGAAQPKILAKQPESSTKQVLDLAMLVPVSANFETATISVKSCAELLGLALALLNEENAKQPFEPLNEDITKQRRATNCRLAAHYLTLLVQATKAVSPEERPHA